MLGDNVVVVITNQTENSPLVGRSALEAAALEAAALVACYTLALLAFSAPSDYGPNGWGFEPCFPLVGCGCWC
jgi:hypothetical protein